MSSLPWSFSELLVKKAPLGRQQWYATVFCYDAISADSPKIEGIEGNRPRRGGEIRRNPAPIALAKFFAAGCHARDQVGPKGGRRWFAISNFLNIYFHIFRPHGSDNLFQLYRTDTQAHIRR